MIETKLRIGSRRRAAWATLAALLLVPTLAKAWTQRADFETHIHGHEFTRVTLDSDGCNVNVRVLFNAPEPAYQNASPARNFYRFHARIKLDAAAPIETRVFSNSAPGWRAYSYVLDTKPEGCWAKDEHKVQGIDVEGCRGAGCKPDPFQ